MIKYHISSNGEPRKCSATEGNCPLGGVHYVTAEEAYAAIAAVNESFSSVKKLETTIENLKILRASNNFPAYAAMRAEIDAKNKAELNEEDRMNFDLDNRLKLRLDSERNSQLSFDLVADHIGGNLDSLYVDRLLGSRFLTEEQRAAVIADSSSFALYQAVERDGNNRHPTTQPLSHRDYKNILARGDEEGCMTLIAKNRNLGFSEKRDLISGNPWGNAMLALHNEKEFFADRELVGRLRRDADLNNNESHALSALASSPFEEDHERVMFNEESHLGYLTPIMGLAENPNLSYKNAKVLLFNESRRESSDASVIARNLLRARPELSGRGKNQSGDSRKYRYTDQRMTDSRRAEIYTELEKLGSDRVMKLGSQELKKHNYLWGKLYANDSDYAALRKEISATKRKYSPRKAENAEIERELNSLGWKLQQADSIRETDRVINLLDS